MSSLRPDLIQEFINTVNGNDWQSTARKSLIGIWGGDFHKERLVGIVLDLFQKLKAPDILDDTVVTGVIDGFIAAVKIIPKSGGDAPTLDNVPPVFNVTGVESAEIVAANPTGLTVPLALLIVVLLVVLCYNVCVVSANVYEKIVQKIRDMGEGGAVLIFRRGSGSGQVSPLVMNVNVVVSAESEAVVVSAVQPPSAVVSESDIIIPGQILSDSEDETAVIAGAGSGGEEEEEPPLTVSGAVTIASMSAMVLACAAIGSIGTG